MELRPTQNMHGRGQREQEPRVAQPGRRPRKDLRHAPRPRPGHGQQRPDDDLGAQASRSLPRAVAASVGSRPPVPAAMGGGRQLVAGARPPPPGARRGRSRGIERDGRPLGGQVDRSLGHALARRAARARPCPRSGAVHAAHGQRASCSRHQRAPNRVKTSSSSSIFAGDRAWSPSAGRRPRTTRGGGRAGASAPGQRALHRRDLQQDVRRSRRRRDHPLQPLHLPLDAPQPPAGLGLRT